MLLCQDDSHALQRSLHKQQKKSDLIVHDGTCRSGGEAQARTRRRLLRLNRELWSGALLPGLESAGILIELGKTRKTRNHPTSYFENVKMRQYSPISCHSPQSLCHHRSNVTCSCDN
uniref:Uncharacterized protein n=1 Tax=Palpitomonas bilix TaxID=652834 RepID=A0A7S3D1F3_9EUKA